MRNREAERLGGVEVDDELANREPDSDTTEKREKIASVHMLGARGPGSCTTGARAGAIPGLEFDISASHADDPRAITESPRRRAAGATAGLSNRAPWRF